MEKTQEIKEKIFRKASTTYYNSSRFFPPETRGDVFTLYAFVRTGDNFVDDQPTDASGFYAFKEAWEQAEKGKASGNPIIDDFVVLSQKLDFKPEWTRAFLQSMEWDLTRTLYDRIEDTLDYIYGSAEVIGLYMARIMRLPPEADQGACLLGRAMQYINFIRDMDEDRKLGRRYLPFENSGLTEITEAEARAKPKAFSSFLRIHAKRYLEWQKAAETAYKYLPKKMLTPIMTAADMYVWTVEKILRNPYLVFKKKVRPFKLRVVGALLLNSLGLGRVKI